MQELFLRGLFAQVTTANYNTVTVTPPGQTFVVLAISIHKGCYFLMQAII